MNKKGVFDCVFNDLRDQAITILKQQLRQVNTAREALKRDEFINASGKFWVDIQKREFAVFREFCEANVFGKGRNRDRAS